MRVREAAPTNHHHSHCTVAYHKQNYSNSQNAARLAKLEGADAAARNPSSAAPPPPVNSEEAAARARRARVDTGSGAGMGSLALAFAGGAGGGGGGGGDSLGSAGYGEAIGGGRGAMAVVTLGASAGSEGASPEVRLRFFVALSLLGGQRSDCMYLGLCLLFVCRRGCFLHFSAFCSRWVYWRVFLSRAGLRLMPSS